jgi:hypothetical protein
MSDFRDCYSIYYRYPPVVTSPLLKRKIILPTLEDVIPEMFERLLGL